jgi:hypothetical protein
MVHPVPRVDRWDAVISTSVLILIAAVVLAASLAGR